MKRTERQHLKENELAQSLATVRDYIDPYRPYLGRILGAIVVIALIAVVVIFIRQRSASQAQQLLAEAMVTMNTPVVPATERDSDGLPASAQLNATGTFATEEAKLKAALPKLQAAADAHPDTQPGIVARYHLAGALAALGRNEEAIKQFGEVAQRAGNDSLYGKMARMGQAEMQARAGQIDAAISSWKQMAAEKDPKLPADAILMQLARAYVAKGNKDEAKKTLTELVDQHPASPYTAEARTELETLKG